jgi:hypothetical protein
MIDRGVKVPALACGAVIAEFVPMAHIQSGAVGAEDRRGGETGA